MDQRHVFPLGFRLNLAFFFVSVCQNYFNPLKLWNCNVNFNSEKRIGGWTTSLNAQTNPFHKHYSLNIVLFSFLTVDQIDCPIFFFPSPPSFWLKWQAIEVLGKMFPFHSAKRVDLSSVCLTCPSHSFYLPTLLLGDTMLITNQLSIFFYPPFSCSHQAAARHVLPI